MVLRQWISFLILLRVVTCFLFIICQILVILKNSKSAIKHSKFTEVVITKKDKCIEEVYSKTLRTSGKYRFKFCCYNQFYCVFSYSRYFTGFKVSFELLLLSRVKSILLLERIISFVYHMFRCLT